MKRSVFWFPPLPTAPPYSRDFQSFIETPITHFMVLGPSLVSSRARFALRLLGALPRSLAGLARFAWRLRSFVASVLVYLK